MKYFYIKILILVSICFISSNYTYASHSAGGYITYKYLSPNTYELKYIMFRDCGGIQEPDSLEINISNSCGFPISNIYLNKIDSGFQVPMLCTSSTICNGGFNYGVEKYTYKDTILLPGQCSWTFSHSENSRPQAISTILDPGATSMYVYSILHNTNFAANNSADFANDPIFNLTINQLNTLEAHAFDSDGDSLSFELVSPRTGSNSTDVVSFLNNYTFDQPCNSLIYGFDTQTGNFLLRPTVLDIGIYAYRINEYRNHILIGQVQVDMLFEIKNFPNMIPNLLDINGQFTLDTTLTPGIEACFSLYSSDLNYSDTTIIIDAAILPIGMTVNHTGGRRDTAVICWTPSLSDTVVNPTNYIFYANDNACPYSGVSAFWLILNVSPTSSINKPQIAETSVFPNPFNNNINIETKGNVSVEINLFDMQGRCILKEKSHIKNTVLDSDHIENGVYILSITETQTGNGYHLKMLKQ